METNGGKKMSDVPGMKLWIPMVLLFSGVVRADPTRIATANIEKLLSGYDRALEARMRIERSRDELEEENQRRLRHVREIEEEQKKRREVLEEPSIPPMKQPIYREWQRWQMEIATLERERLEFVAARSELIDQEAEEITARLLTALRKRVEDYAEAEEFDYVFDNSPAGPLRVPFLLYAKEGTDITDALLRQMIPKEEDD